MITVANVRTFRGDSRTAMMVDRTSPYGNPFKIGPDAISRHWTRNDVCNLFDTWWQMDAQRELRASFAAAVQRHGITTILCHCVPARCHADTLARWYNTTYPDPPTDNA